MVEYLYLFVYKIASFLLRFISPPRLVRLMRWMAKGAYIIDRKHRHIVETNLKIAFGESLTPQETKEIVIESTVNLLDTLFGIIRSERLDKARVIENVTFEGEEIVQKIKESGKNFLFVTGHYGNWELISQALAIKFDFTLVGVGRELDSKLMDARLKRNRERFNVEMVYKRGAMRGCIQALNANKAVGILVDQSLPLSQGMEISFFSHRATHTKLASILARRYECDLIPVFIHTDDYIHYHATIHTPIAYQKTLDTDADILAMTQAQADIMEQVIRQDPKQWFWQHKRWKVFYPQKYERG